MIISFSDIRSYHLQNQMFYGSNLYFFLFAFSCAAILLTMKELLLFKSCYFLNSICSMIVRYYGNSRKLMHILVFAFHLR